MNGTELPFFYGPVRVCCCSCYCTERLTLWAQSFTVKLMITSGIHFTYHMLAHKFTQQTASTSRTQHTLPYVYVFSLISMYYYDFFSFVCLCGLLFNKQKDFRSFTQFFLLFIFSLCNHFCQLALLQIINLRKQDELIFFCLFRGFFSPRMWNS